MGLKEQRRLEKEAELVQKRSYLTEFLTQYEYDESQFMQYMGD